MCPLWCGSDFCFEDKLSRSRQSTQGTRCTNWDLLTHISVGDEVASAESEALLTQCNSLRPYVICFPSPSSWLNGQETHLQIELSPNDHRFMFRPWSRCLLNNLKMQNTRDDSDSLTQTSNLPLNKQNLEQFHHSPSLDVTSWSQHYTAILGTIDALWCLI